MINQVNHTITIPNETDPAKSSARHMPDKATASHKPTHTRAMQHSRDKISLRISTLPVYAVYRRCARLLRVFRCHVSHMLHARKHQKLRSVHASRPRQRMQCTGAARDCACTSAQLPQPHIPDPWQSLPQSHPRLTLQPAHQISHLCWGQQGQAC
jgi:hypothetical protein